MLCCWLAAIIGSGRLSLKRILFLKRKIMHVLSVFSPYIRQALLINKNLSEHGLNSFTDDKMASAHIQG